MTLQYDGRLSNNLIQFLAAYFFAKKNGLYFRPDISRIKEYSGSDYLLIKEENLPLPGVACRGDIVVVDDSNFLQLFFGDVLEPAHYHLTGFFQQLDFLSFIQPYINEIFDIKHNFRKKEVFVHFRIGDLVMYQRGDVPIWSPKHYFNEALKKIKFRNGWISSDTPDHSDVKWLSKKFNLRICDMSPLDTIMFAKDSEFLVLSEYSFSGLIGYFSQGSTIWCNRRQIWSVAPGTILSGFDHYNLLSWTYDEDIVPVNNNHSELNALYDSIKDEDISFIRKWSTNQDSIFEISFGTARETLGIIKSYPEKLTSYYLNDPSDSGTDIGYVFKLANETGLDFKTTETIDFDKADCLIITHYNEDLTEQVLKVLNKVEKRIIILNNFTQLIKTIMERSFTTIATSSNFIILDRLP